SLSQRIVGRFMQLNAVAISFLEPFTTDGIKARGMLVHGAVKNGNLFRRWIEMCHNRSIHAQSRSYVPGFVNRHRFPFPPVPKPHERKTCFLPIAEARDIRRSSLMKEPRRKGGGLVVKMLNGFTERPYVSLLLLHL